MKRYLYVVKDMASDMVHRVYECGSDELAKRDLSIVVNGPKDNAMALFASDMRLYRIGSFDPNDMLLESDVTFICSLDALFNEQLHKQICSIMDTESEDK